MHREAFFYRRIENNKVICDLCPHNCIISDNHSGICRVRKNTGGTLVSEVYGRPVSIHSDPVEKKPLYHFYPGHLVLSLGTFGCNLKCDFCQNCEISQASCTKDEVAEEKNLEEIIMAALIRKRNIGLAYTYNEPVVFYEYMYDLGKIIKEKGLKNIMVTNGYINPGPLIKILEVIDAFNIDLKAFSDQFYKKFTKSSLNPVLDTIASIAGSGKHLELTFLVIPNLNDDFRDFEKMLKWIVENCGKKTVLHLSRYFPAHRMTIPPTPVKILENLYNLARKQLDFVYIGNVQGSNSNSTLCPSCGKLLISRNGYHTTFKDLDFNGKCKNCKEQVINYIKKIED